MDNKDIFLHCLFENASMVSIYENESVYLLVARLLTMNEMDIGCDKHRQTGFLMILHLDICHTPAPVKVSVFNFFLFWKGFRGFDGKRI